MIDAALRDARVRQMIDAALNNEKPMEVRDEAPLEKAPELMDSAPSDQPGDDTADDQPPKISGNRPIRTLTVRISRGFLGPWP